MDLDHLFTLVAAARDEAERLNDAGPAYAELERYIASPSPWTVKRVRELEAGLAEALDMLDEAIDETPPGHPRTDNRAELRKLLAPREP